MKNLLLFPLVLIPAFLLAFFFAGCSDSSTTPPNPAGGGQNNYNSISNYGDIVRVTFNTGKDAGGSYSWTNETLNLTDNGTYTVSTDPNLTGIYVTNSGDYIIEAPNLSFLTTLDFGRPQNQFSFGINSNQNLHNLTVTGDYIWISFSDDSTNFWGGYRLNADGTCTYGFAPDDPSQVTNFNYFQGGGSGNWAISSQDSSRILFTEGGLTFIGTIYPEKYMEISNGPGLGMSLGIKYPSAPITLNQIAGTYRGIDYTDDGNIGVGYYTLPSSSAPVTCYFKYLNPSIISQGTTSGNISRHPGINNIFLVNDVKPGEYDYTVYFILLGGESMMHFAIDNIGTSYSSGTCLKIN
jgi:hypothetical protein